MKKMVVDKISGGIAGKILRVNLSNGKISTEDTEKYAKRFIGGRAINRYILLNEMDPKTKWSDPENMVIIGVGCLSGTLAPGTSRVSIDTKNVYFGGVGSANFGGHFGAELKYAGFDHVVITGRSKKPVYLWICDGKAELRDANFLWGKTTYETEETLQKELGDDRIKVISIGPAGENLVKGACIVGDCGKVGGGSGIGCILGNKKIKAVAVRGHGSIKVAEPEKFLKAVDASLQKILASKNAIGWRGSIINCSFLPEHKFAWDVFTINRNGQDEYWPQEKRERLTNKETGTPSFIKRVQACVSCPIGCMPYSQIDKGKYKGTKGPGYWINSAMYSQKFDVDDPAASLKWHLLANQLGVDGDMASNVCAWAFECYQRGLLTKEDTDGLELEWGDGDAMVDLLEKLVYRKGIGKLLADGVVEASRKLGKGSEKFALHVKGQDTFEPFRILKGWALGVATSPCGPRHLRGAVCDPSTTGPRGTDFDPFKWEGIAEVVYWQAITKELEDITGTCVYMGSFFGVHDTGCEPSDYADLVSSAMGIGLTEEEFNLIGRRSINLEKAFNTIHANLDRKDDYPPTRFMEEPIKSGPYTGWICEREKFDKALDELYEIHGWDRRSGLQTRECLDRLGMEDVAEKLERMGRLIG